jgi:hypothetical protein
MAAGRTKHRNTAHPALSFPDLYQQNNRSGASASQLAASPEPASNAPSERDDNEDHSGGSRSGTSPPPEADCEYIGPGDHLY